MISVDLKIGVYRHFNFMHNETKCVAMASAPQIGEHVNVNGVPMQVKSVLHELDSRNSCCRKLTVTLDEEATL